VARKHLCLCSVGVGEGSSDDLMYKYDIHANICIHVSTG